MAALTITAVRPTATSEVRVVPYGETIVPGDVLYLGPTKYLKADADASALTKAARSIALTPGIDDGHGAVCESGNVILVGASMTQGVTYFLGPTAGQIVPFADLGSADYVVRIGTAKSATELILSIEDTGVLTP